MQLEYNCSLLPCPSTHLGKVGVILEVNVFNGLNKEGVAEVNEGNSHRAIKRPRHFTRWKKNKDHYFDSCTFYKLFDVYSLLCLKIALNVVNSGVQWGLVMTKKTWLCCSGKIKFSVAGTALPHPPEALCLDL